MSQDHNHLNHATWECKYEKGHLMPDHVHADIPPKYSAAEVIGYLKGELDLDARIASCGILWVTNSGRGPSGGTRR